MSLTAQSASARQICEVRFGPLLRRSRKSARTAGKRAGGAGESRRRHESNGSHGNILAVCSHLTDVNVTLRSTATHGDPVTVATPHGTVLGTERAHLNPVREALRADDAALRRRFAVDPEGGRPPQRSQRSVWSCDRVDGRQKPCSRRAR